MPADPPLLFTPMVIRGVEVANRLWAAPMCQYAVDDLDGIPGMWHLTHLAGFARGGTGLIMTEATAVEPAGRISPFDTGIWNDDQRDAWRPIVAFLHQQGSKAGIQLAHAGAKASTRRPWDGGGRIGATAGGWTTVGPSPRELPDHEALDETGIQQIVEKFASAAQRAVEAGFDVIEVHAAHGYLIHQFLSPVANSRSDHYGGSLENRVRLLVDVVTAVRDAIGADRALFVRFSAVDYVDGGIDLEQTCRFVELARDAGADLFDLSSGGLQTEAISTHPGYQVPFAAEVRRATGALVSAVGLITDPAQAEQVLESGSADAVRIGRELLRDPHFVARSAAALGIAPPSWPDNYLRARWS